ncbi:hypothetical protein JM78_23090 [Burkholderia pyrrocinia]|nr:hypothetical protein JM78_23090 [Burkholderia pyrrocinia]
MTGAAPATRSAERARAARPFLFPALLRFLQRIGDDREQPGNLRVVDDDLRREHAMSPVSPV